MSKTFDNISEASATNYLFLFAQRTLALQNEPPTPPPLNALGLPCEAISRLWAQLYPEKANEYLSSYLKSIGAARTVVADTAVADTVEEKAAEEKAAAGVTADKATQGEEKLPIEEAATLEVSSAAEASGEGAAAAEKLKATQGGAEKEKTFAETIAPLAEKVTAYILDHQDDAAQEDRWRTTMKRKMSESFRAQREAAKKQREVIDGQFKRQREEVQSMQQRFDLVHSKLDETIQIVKVIATQSGV